METPKLVISNPPHGEVDLQAVAKLLSLDDYVTRLKMNFAAPEVLSASGPEEAEEFSAELRRAGLTVSIIDGAALWGLPWPDPVISLSFDESGLRATVQEGTVQIPYHTELVAVYCQPPADFSMDPTVDLGAAITSGHGPMIAEGIQWLANLDMYFTESGSLRRISIVPEHSSLDAESVIGELERRFRRIHLDTRLAGVRPRARFIMGEAGFDPDQRKRYSFGTLLLCHILESISPELRDVPQFELGSRLAYALSSHGVSPD